MMGFWQVIPAMPSQKPNLAKIRNAIASLCFRYFLSSNLSENTGGEVGASRGTDNVGSPLAVIGVLEDSSTVEESIAEGDMIIRFV